MMLHVNAKPPPRALHTSRDWAQAEENAASWMRYWGFVDAQVTGGGSDRGIDVRARGGLAQVKFQGKPVGSPALQNLVGARGNDHSKALLFFSNTRYSAPAVQYADAMNVALFTYDREGTPTAVNRCARHLVKVTQANYASNRRRRRVTWALMAALLAVACLSVLFVPFDSPAVEPRATRERQALFGALAAVLGLGALWGFLGGPRPREATAVAPAWPDPARDQYVADPAKPVLRDARRAPDSPTPRQEVHWRPVSDDGPPWFDYRATVQEVLNALIAIHARGNGSLPALDNDRSEVTIVPDWVREHRGLRFLKARLDPSPASPNDTIRIYWSTYSTAEQATDDLVNDAAQDAAERANTMLANFLGDWVQTG